MKRLQALALATALLIGLCATGCQGGGTPPAAEPTAAPTAEPTPTPAPVPNPLTGQMDGEYTGSRPVAVSLRTLAGAEPQWGLSAADIIVEGVCEGTTAGMLALYPSAAALTKVGPVGPGRDLTLQFALPQNAIPVMIGKNIYASNLLNALGYQDLDGLHIGTAAFAFDSERSNAGFREENCWYTTPDLIAAGLAQYGTDANGASTPFFTFAAKELPAEGARNGTALTIGFSPSDAETLVYTPETAQYLKQNADGSPTLDADNGQQVGFTNVFVLYASSGIKDDGYTRQYDMTVGTGLYLYGGAWQQITWAKEDATAPLVLTTPDGAPLTVAPGKSFIAVWGGYYGQSLRLLGADGAEQTLPGRPALLESGITDEQAIAAEQEMAARQAVVDAQAAVEAATLDLAYAQGELNEAREALAAAQATEEPEDDEPAAAAVAAVEQRIAELTARRDENQAVVDAANPPAEEPAPEGEAPADGEPPAEEPPAEEPPAEDAPPAE